MMFKQLRFELVFLMLLVVLSGCKTTSYYPLSDQIVGQLGATDVYVLVPQKQVAVKIKDSKLRRYSTGAISFAVLSIADSIVEKGRSSKAHQLAQPLIETLADIDFGDLYTQELKRQLTQSSWLNLANITLISELDKTTKEALFHSSNADAVLFLTTSYQLSHDFSSLSMNAYSELLPKNENLKHYVRDPSSYYGKSDQLHASNHLYEEYVVVDFPILDSDTAEALDISDLTSHTALFRHALMELALDAATVTSQKLFSTPLLADTEQPAS